MMVTKKGALYQFQLLPQKVSCIYSISSPTFYKRTYIKAYEYIIPFSFYQHFKFKKKTNRRYSAKPIMCSFLSIVNFTFITET
jgi:hypothetical protein